MASDINDRPMFRISDVEELIRQVGMDSSDNGERIVDYFKNRRAAQQNRGRLYDGSDNNINFRLDNLQPVQRPQTSSNNLPMEECSPVHGSNGTEATSVALVQPLSELSVVENRIPSFVSPGGAAATSPVYMAKKSHANVTTSSTNRNKVHVSPMVSNPNLLSATTNLQKQLLLQQYKRNNQMKCETIRNASQLLSSTPIAGDSSQRRGYNRMDITETISPIHEDQEQGTPQRVLRSPTVNQQHIAPGPSTASARTINTPVPATQDVPDAMDRNCRENTPPHDESRVIVPETPSPVRRSPRIPSTPLSGLTLHHRPHCANHFARHGRPESATRSSSSTPAQRSILKNADRSFSSVKNRVSFSDKLIAVRSLTPDNSSDDSPITSDESDEQEAEMNEPSRKQVSLSRMQRSSDILKLRRSRFVGDDVETEHVRTPEIATKQVENSNNHNRSNGNNSSSELAPHEEVEPSGRTEERSVQHSRRLFGNRRSNAIECIDEPLPASPEANGRSNNHTNGRVMNMIMEDWNETASVVMEVDDANESHNRKSANKTINQSLAITNIDTPRTVMMDIFDPPSAFCDNSRQDHLESPQNGLIAEEIISDAPGLVQLEDSSRKRKQDSPYRRVLNDENEPGDAQRPKMSMLSKSAAQSVVLPAERIVNVDSPNDHVPMNMIEVVDMIHSRASSELIASESENDRRTTLNVPPKRRHTKLQLDATTKMYLKSVAKSSAQDKRQSEKLKNRRKLFVNELLEEQDKEHDGCDEPQPLPLTQDVADPPQSQKQAPEYGIKPLCVLVPRLSANTLAIAAESTLVPQNAEAAMETDERCDKPVESPIKEKQNEEQNEKGDRPKKVHGETPPPAIDDSEPRVVEAEKTARQTSKQRKRTNAKKHAKRNDGERNESVMMDKYLKNVSNEIRHQIENEGPRRSHRNRRLAAEVLRNNPNISRHDAPKYVMPTIKDVLRYCKFANETHKAGKGTKKSKSSNNAASKKGDKNNQDVVPAVTVSSEQRDEMGTKRKRGRPAKELAAAQKEKFDKDGFRVPPVPTDEIRSTETMCSSTSGLPQGVSTDSGLSSVAMMSDDATEVPQPEQRSTSKSVSMPKKTPNDRDWNDGAAASSSGSSSSSSASPPADMLLEKRKTLDWMMMLMEHRQKRPVALPMVEIQGFTHLSLEHLAFEERDGIEYSFYVYSNGDNFGFLRFPPRAEKKTTRTKRCSLKFLILSGSLKFIINESMVNVVGGDFLMIPTSTSYRIVNGADTTLMFMIKTSVSTNENQTTRENGG